MKHWFAVCSMLILVLCTLPCEVLAQKSSVGGRFGISFGSGGGASEAGLQLGPAFDYEFSKGMIVGTEFNINTQTGTPIEWPFYFKYLIPMKTSKTVAYVDGGFGLWLATGGPFFGIRFGGGAYFNVGPNLSVPADLQLGPVFVAGTSAFYFALTSGIRYTLP